MLGLGIIVQSMSKAGPLRGKAVRETRVESRVTFPARGDPVARSGDQMDTCEPIARSLTGKVIATVVIAKSRSHAERQFVPLSIRDRGTRMRCWGLTPGGPCRQADGPEMVHRTIFSCFAKRREIFAAAWININYPAFH
jgi:hypothetical protein